MRETIANYGILLAGTAALWWGAVELVEGATRVARRLGLSELVIGLTVVAFGTSAPEFAVSVGAALKGQSDISIGNVVGSNIFNLGIILGCVALLRPIQTSRALVRRDGMALLATTLLLILFFRDHVLSQWEGIALMIGLGCYLAILLRSGEMEEEIPAGDFRWLDVARLLGGLALVVAGGHWLVASATALARAYGVSEWLIALTIVGAGTSAPELATSLVAAVKGRPGISIGNLVGSDLFNMLGVLGLAATIHPLELNPNGMISLVAMSATVAVVILAMRTGRRVSRWEGVLLIAIGLSRWLLDAAR